MEGGSNIIKYCTYTPVSQRFNFLSFGQFFLIQQIKQPQYYSCIILSIGIFSITCSPRFDLINSPIDIMVVPRMITMYGQLSVLRR